MITPYPNEIEQSIKEFFNSLPEKNSRRYAAVEAQKSGRSGICYIAKKRYCRSWSDVQSHDPQKFPSGKYAKCIV
jgi:hypothetical protein